MPSLVVLFSHYIKKEWRNNLLTCKIFNEKEVAARTVMQSSWNYLLLVTMTYVWSNYCTCYILLILCFSCKEHKSRVLSNFAIMFLKCKTIICLTKEYFVKAQNLHEQQWKVRD